MENYLLGGLSSSIATIFTNPLEVIKTRLQLQGELKAKGRHVEPYKNFLQGFIQIAKHESIKALQKGLVPSLYFQFSLNACRLGIYQTACENNLTKNSKGNESIIKAAFFGGVGGTIGQALASPFFMVRNQIQSAAAQEIAVGYQHHHESMSKALRKIYLQHGISGLYRGVLVTIPRGMLGSGTQIAAFGCTKDILNRYSELNPTIISFISSCVAGTLMTIVMHPFDSISTRIYNQKTNVSGQGMYYKGVIDCLMKIIKFEGFRGLYKGFWPHYVRMGTHSVLVLVFFDELKALKSRLQKKITIEND
ncbi:hypothetical protein PVAND_002885 [Polypedilum vanderplanki]|uniref:Mitochondrial carrier protein n=1 Tax=Polypedilum vanderplanki TaxID=319348 RepID=A0A9J6BSH9_POLVA|nr:hypothetical protein PVAND_002885 [Polypedilum vanderplanki]